MTVITPIVSQWNTARPPAADNVIDRDVADSVAHAIGRPIDRDQSGDFPDVDYSRLKFLVIDDSRFCRTLIRNALAVYRISDVLEAADADAALDILQTIDVDFVLVDYEMPGSDGVEFTRRIRWSEGGKLNPEVPIIMISRHTDKSIVLAARDAGIHEYVGKPVVPTELFRRIRATLEHPRPFVSVETYRGPDRRWIGRD